MYQAVYHNMPPFNKAELENKQHLEVNEELATEVAAAIGILGLPGDTDGLGHKNNNAAPQDTFSDQIVGHASEADLTRQERHVAQVLEQIRRESAERIFKGVQVIMAVTTSQNKLNAIREFLAELGLNQFIVVGVPSIDREPKYGQAGLVAMNKANGMVDLSELEIDVQTLIDNQGNVFAKFGSDIVARVNGNHVLNFSRLFDFKDLQDPTKLNELIKNVREYKEELKKAYSAERGATIEYDVTLALSVQNSDGEVYNAVVGNRVVVKLRQIPEDIIDAVYKDLEDYLYNLANNPKKTKIRRQPKELGITGINVGLPVVDPHSPINQYVEHIDIYPIRPFTDDDVFINNEPRCGPGKTPQPYFSFDALIDNREQIRNAAIKALSQIIMGGIPKNSIDMFQGRPTKTNGNGTKFKILGSNGDCDQFE